MNKLTKYFLKKRLDRADNIYDFDAYQHQVVPTYMSMKERRNILLH